MDIHVYADEAVVLNLKQDMPPSQIMANQLYINNPDYVEHIPIILLDIPLSYDLQYYTIITSKQYEIPHELIFAIMMVESEFKEDVISNRNYGLMQINIINHEWLRTDYNITNILEPQQNILAGIIIYKQYYDNVSDIHMALTSYRYGPTGARNKYFNKGLYTSGYSRNVVSIMEEFINFKE